MMKGVRPCSSSGDLPVNISILCERRVEARFIASFSIKLMVLNLSQLDSINRKTCLFLR